MTASAFGFSLLVTFGESHRALRWWGTSHKSKTKTQKRDSPALLDTLVEGVIRCREVGRVSQHLCCVLVLLSFHSFSLSLLETLQSFAIYNFSLVSLACQSIEEDATYRLGNDLEIVHWTCERMK